MRAAKRVIERMISKNAMAAGSSADVDGKDMKGRWASTVERTPFNPTGQAEVPSAQNRMGEARGIK